MMIFFCLALETIGRDDPNISTNFNVPQKKKQTTSMEKKMCEKCTIRNEERKVMHSILGKNIQNFPIQFFLNFFQTYLSYFSMVSAIVWNGLRIFCQKKISLFFLCTNVYFFLNSSIPFSSFLLFFQRCFFFDPLQKLSSLILFIFRYEQFVILPFFSALYDSIRLLIIIT